MTSASFQIEEAGDPKPGIYLGDIAGIDTSDLGEDGFRIFSDGDRLCIAGGNRGVIYGVYEFLESLGENFGRLHELGIDAMVAKITIEYKLPLISGDKFVVGINLKRQGAKILFLQDIYRLSDGKLCTKGCVETICVQNGRLTRGELFDEVFKDYL